MDQQQNPDDRVALEQLRIFPVPLISPRFWLEKMGGVSKDQEEKQAAAYWHLLDEIDAAPAQHGLTDLSNVKLFMQQAVQIDSRYASAANTGLRDDEDFMAAACMKMGSNLAHASARLSNSLSLCAIACIHTQCIGNIFDHPLKHASMVRRSDKQFVQKVVERCGLAVEFASEALRNDLSVMRTCFESTYGGSALRYASPRLRDNAFCVAGAVRKTGAALRFASPRLRGHMYLVHLACVESHRLDDIMKTASEPTNYDQNLDDDHPMQYVTRSQIRAYKPLVILAARRCGKVLAHIDAALLDDRDVIIAAARAARNSHYSLMYASSRLRHDRQCVEIACENNGNSLAYASDALRKDQKIVVAAIKDTGTAIEFAEKTGNFSKEVSIVVAAQQAFTEINLLCHIDAQADQTFRRYGIADYARRNLDLRTSFCGTFLCAIGIGRGAIAKKRKNLVQKCCLPLLNLEPVKRLVAAFLDVPIGRTWKAVRFAALQLGLVRLSLRQLFPRFAQFAKGDDHAIYRLSLIAYESSAELSQSGPLNAGSMQSEILSEARRILGSNIVERILDEVFWA